jgi:hypothetical protein
MVDAIKKPEPASPADHSPEVNFALVLSRMIESVGKDPALLRGTVYELARVKLLEQVVARQTWLCARSAAMAAAASAARLTMTTTS